VQSIERLVSGLETGWEFARAGEFPAPCGDVPEGDYTVAAWHHQKRQEQKLSVKGSYQPRED